MSAFGGLILTNKGRALQAKAQIGTQLNFTKIKVGDGELGGSSILDLNNLKHEVKTLTLNKLKTLPGGKAVVGGILTNEGLLSGFYWREVGVFAQDPDVGEILYCYGNAGSNAEYIPATGGADIIEKTIDIVTLIGNASNVTAELNSLIQVTSVNNKTGDVVLTAADVGAVPTTRKVNNKVLSGDITLTTDDIKNESGQSVTSLLGDIATNLKDNALQTISVDKPINTLANVVDGLIQIDSIKGRTIKNLLGDIGNCEDLSKWIGGNPTVDTTTKLFGTGSIKYSLNNSSVNNYRDISCDQTHKYFLSGHCYISSYTSGEARLDARDYGGVAGATPLNFDTTKLNQWQRKSAIVTGKANNGIRIYIGSMNTSTITMQYDGIMLYDLTEIFGAGKEPTDIILLEQLLTYVDGIKSVGEVEGNKIEILSTGKNLFDKSKSTRGTVSSNGVLFPDPNSLNGFTDFIPVKAGYSYHKVVTYNSCLYDKNKKFVSVLPTAVTVTPVIDGYIVCNFEWAKLDTYQIEPGTTATAYEAYKFDKSSIQFKEPPRSLPNGVSDEGKGNKFTKRVKKDIFNGSENWLTGQNMTNTMAFGLPLPLAKPSSSATDLICDNFSSIEPLWNSTIDKEGVDISGSPAVLTISILKSKLTTQDVSGFKAWLSANPTTVYYELATPVEEEIQVPTLKVFKGGSIQINNVITPTNITLKYPTNVLSRVQTVEFELDKTSDKMKEVVTRYQIYRSGKDTNGIFTVVDKKRDDGSLYEKSVLSGGTSPNYTTRTITKYDTNGSTIISTTVRTLTYDTDGDFLTEV